VAIISHLKDKMAYYDPRQSPVQTTTTPTSVRQHSQMSALPGQTTSLVGASPSPNYGRQQVVPRILNAPYAQTTALQPRVGVLPGTNPYGTSTTAQYLAGAQPGMAATTGGMAGGLGGGIPQAMAGSYGLPPAAGTYQQPYPGQPGYGGVGVPVPGAAPPPQGTGSYSYPGTSNAPGYGHGPHHGGHILGDEQHHGRRPKRKSKLRKILEELLEGSAGITAASYLHHRHDQEEHPSQSQSRPPPAPQGSALGFLHPEGHFVPRSLEDMIDHFVHGKKEKDIAPDGSKPGYLHPGSHFVPAPIEHLIDQFKWTLLDRHGSHGRRRKSRHGGTSGRRNISGSESDSEYYSDATDGTTASSSTDSGHRRHGRHRHR
jgi:hypothetical protein